MTAKSQQLQIRVTPEQKVALQQLAAASGQDVSSYVLSRALPEARLRFREIVRAMRDFADHRFGLAELNELLAGMTAAQFSDAVETVPAALWNLSPLLQNYIAAMVEQAANLQGVPPPLWVRDVIPLEEAHFATDLSGLRLHLLRFAPVPFKRRNIFADSSVGARV